MVGGLSSAGGFSITSLSSPSPAASPLAPAVSSPASAVPSQNPSLRALQGESGFDGQVGIPATGGSLNSMFQRMVNDIRNGTVLNNLPLVALLKDDDRR
jgi:hypothetical protein